MDSEIGPRTVLLPLIHGDKAPAGSTSPELLAVVERRVGLLLREAESEAERLLRQRRDELDSLRKELREKKVVEFPDAVQTK
jgi:ATP-dependent Zn protease